MKRFLILILSLLLVFSLVACNSNENPDPSGSNNNDDPLNRDPGTSQTDNQGGTSTPADIDFNSILSGNGSTNVVWGKQDEATKQAIIDDAAKDGLTVTFGTDGSMTITDTDGSVITQNPDGTWKYEDASGGEVEFGDDWPENEYTKKLPKPDFEISYTSVDDAGFTVVSESATVDELRAYVEKLKKAGFNVDPQVQDMEVYGIVVYTYWANNADGDRVEVAYASGNSMITMS